VGRLTPGTCVDHIVPHRGDMTLFWDPTNWQTLCDSCHGKKTTREDGGFGRAPARASVADGQSNDRISLKRKKDGQVVSKGTDKPFHGGYCNLCEEPRQTIANKNK
jgi:HNH endonuclease